MKRLLPVRGKVHHSIAHLAKKLRDLKPRGLKRAVERGGIWAHVALAVKGQSARLCSISDQGVRAGGLNRRQTASNVARAKRRRHGRDKRVIAARVQHDKTEAGGLRGRARKQVKRDRLKLYIQIGLQSRVYRHHEVAPVHLNAVTCVVDDRVLSADGTLLKVPECDTRLRVIKVCQPCDLITKRLK